MGNDWAGFFFVGSGILPGFITLAGDPGLAAITFVFLFLLGGLGGIADPEAPFRTREGRKAPKRR